MANDLNSKDEQNTPNNNEDDTEKSFVGKFKSIISNTPLSKWFRKPDDTRSTIRRRDEEIDEVNQMQPPAKRAKFPDGVGNNLSHMFPTNSSDNTFISEILINKTYNHFPEPVAGPSGLKPRKLLNNVNNPSHSARNIFSNDIFNGQKDSDSEESTSGYSSVARIGSKEHVSHSEGSSKQPSPLQTNSPNNISLFQSPVASTNRSLFSERTTSPNLNASMSSRRPCFNASTFGSPNFIDKTISTEKIINSPFYNGTTIYGGASAYGRKLGRSARDLRASLKRSVHIKPVNKTKDGGNLVLGKTARKILETLEQYSTPVNDAKKIPLASKRFRPDDSLLGKHVGTNPYAVQADTPSKRELQVPTVSDLLKMKQKAKLQNSTEAVRHIAISSQLDLNTVSSKLEKNVTDKNQKLPEKSDEVEPSKEKVKGSFHTDEPQVSPGLPISPLPKSDLNTISSVTKKTAEKVITFTEKKSILSTSKPQNMQESKSKKEINRNFQRDLLTVTSQFKFSNPLVIAENLKSIVAMNNFKFSEPLSKTNKVDSKQNKPIKGKNNGQNIKDKLSNSSVLDKFKPAAGTWECSSCLIRNQPDKSKCVACEALNPKLKSAQSEVNKPLMSFGDNYKMTNGMWECPVCMIRNSNDKTKCVACESPNPKPSILTSSTQGFQGKFQPPANTWECPTCMIRNKEELSKCAACETPRISKSATASKTPIGFQGKFQPPANTWECSTCMIRNNEDLSKCAACEAPKISKTAVTNQQATGGFQDKFKPPPNTWECPTCMIRNKEEVSKCVACETSRIIKAIPNNQLSYSFKMKDDEWECSVCMVRNNSNHAKCQCCEASRPGTNTNVVVQEVTKKPVTKFNFGIDKKSATSFSFGIPPSSTVPNLPASSAAVPAAVPAVGFGDATKTNKTAPVPTFSFGLISKPEKEKSIEAVKPAESKLTLSTVTPSTAIVKPVVSVPEKTEANSTLFKGSGSTIATANTNPVSKVASKDSNSTKPITGLGKIASFEPTAKPSFNFGAKFDNKGKNTTAVPPIPKFEFIKSTNSSLPNDAQNQQSQVVVPTPVPTFGTANKPVNSAAPSVFGQKLPPVNNGLAIKNVPTFGAGATPATSLNTSASKTSESKPFSFTQPDTGEPHSKAPMFNFGQSANSAINLPTTQPSGFNFGQTAKSPVFNFSANKSDTLSSVPSGNLFSGPNNTASSKNGIFNFGGTPQNTAPQKVGFNYFGTVSAPPSSGFNFGASTASALVAPAVTPAAPTGGFNFTAAFDANAKPSFNFSDSPVTFVAQPPADGGVAAPRKIKKAVRRTR